MLDPGTHLGPYEILEQVGSGGMGDVYLADDTRLGRKVALKLLNDELPGVPEAEDQLLEEARTASSLNHPHICTVHEVGESNGRPFVVMEYVEGRPLSELIPAGGTPVEDVVGYGLQIADALAHAHDRGVIHRDLKPANVHVTPEGRAKVLDFGLAVHRPPEELDRDAGSRLTVERADSTVGTLQYMAPEVFRGGTADRHSDIWSLGVVLHEMATGELPFEGDTPYELSSTILRDQPKPLPGDLPSALRNVVKRCLAKDPARRYRRAGEVRSALKTLQEVLGEAMPSTPTRAAQRVGTSRIPGTAESSEQPVSNEVDPADEDPSDPGPAAGADGPGPIRSLAVLPLTDLADDPSRAFFADGMTEALINDLAKLSGVKVISRTSAMRYKDTVEPLPEIAGELDVDAVVEGSVLRAGDRVRITAQLIHAATDTHLWADSYEHDLEDVLALQREVAAAIAREIRGTLELPDAGDRDPSSTSVDPIAYEAFLRGRACLDQQTPTGLRNAAEWFERAIERDPDSPLAHSSMAILGAYEAIYGEERPPTEVMPRAERAAHRALELDPDAAQAHVALGIVELFYNWNLKAAEESFRRSQELNPNLADSRYLLGWYHVALERPAKAVDVAREAVEVDPVNAIPHADLAIFLSYVGELREAESTARRAIEVDPNHWRGHWALALTLQPQDRAREAEAAHREATRLSQGGSLSQSYLALWLAAHGQRDEAKELYEDLVDRREEGYISAYVLAIVRAALGDDEGALEWLEVGLEERTFYMVFLRTIAPRRLPSLHGDPRLQRILNRVGLSPPPEEG